MDGGQIKKMQRNVNYEKTYKKKKLSLTKVLKIFKFQAKYLK